MNAIELSGVDKTFGKVRALADLTLDVRAGELTALLGPNGAGKTTAISLMLGLAQPTRGSVRVLGEDPRRDAVRTGIGSMPQESAIPQALTVREAVTLFARLYPAPLAVNKALELAQLQDVAGRRAGALSGGQARRLAFALAVVGNPQVLFLDEPTTGMDAGSRQAFWAAVDGLKAAGRTILLTTHYGGSRAHRRPRGGHECRQHPGRRHARKPARGRPDQPGALYLRSGAGRATGPARRGDGQRGFARPR